MDIENGKQYQTRNGLPARVYAMDGFGNFPIHGAVLTDFGWEICEWTETGCASLEGSPDSLDLVEIPPEPTYRPFLPDELPRIVGRRVRSKQFGFISVIVCYCDLHVTMIADRSGMLEFDIRALFENFEFLDFDDSGNVVVTPCGILVKGGE